MEPTYSSNPPSLIKNVMSADKVPFLYEVDASAVYQCAPESFNIPAPVEVFKHALLSKEYFVEHYVDHWPPAKFLRCKKNSTFCRVISPGKIICIDNSIELGALVTSKERIGFVPSVVHIGDNQYVCQYEYAGVERSFLDVYKSHATDFSNFPDVLRLLYCLTSDLKVDELFLINSVLKTNLISEKLTHSELALVAHIDWMKKVDEKFEAHRSRSVSSNFSAEDNLMTDDEYEVYKGESR